MRSTLLIGLLAASAVLIIAVNADQSSGVRSDFKLPKLFDFNYYKQHFKKHYASVSDHMVRHHIFLARAYRAFISGVSYKFRLDSYHLALNDFSDWTPAEIEASRANTVKELAHLETKRARKGCSKGSHENPPMMSEKVLQKKLKKIKSRSNEPGFGIIAKEVESIDDEFSAKTLEQAAPESKTRQDFSWTQLFADVGLNADEDSDDEADGFGCGALGCFHIFSTIKDSLKNLFRFANTDDKSEEQLARVLSGAENDRDQEHEAALQVQKQDGKSKLPDEVFSDLRTTSDCISPIKNQGQCGSCYAYVSTGYYEWAICKETKQKLDLSEQYMVDCAVEISREDFAGCGGGFLDALGNFYQKYGFEPTSKYPYVGLEGKCPYATADNSGTYRGYKPERLFWAAKKDFPEFLKHGPLAISMGDKGNIREYGGGVHYDVNCCGVGVPQKDCGGHAMLLIGHGRQDGDEYWLFKNSWGMKWGEKGYYKMSKRAKCMNPEFGYMYSTEDGRNITIGLTVNDKRPKGIDELIKDPRRYKRSNTSS